MNKFNARILVAFMVIMGLLTFTSVAMADDSMALTSSVSVAIGGNEFGKLSVGEFNGEAFCALTVTSLTNGKLTSNLPFEVQGGDHNLNTVNSKGVRMSGSAVQAFGVTAISQDIGDMPQPAPSNVDTVIFWGNNVDVVISSGSTQVARMRFYNGECALVFESAVDLLVHNSTNFMVGAGVYTPSTTMNIGGLTIVEWREGTITGTFGSSDFQILMPALPVPGTNVNAVVLSLSQQVVVVPTAVPGLPVVTSTPAVASLLPAAVSTGSQNGWNVQFLNGATAEMLAYQFPALSPRVWNVFPNVDHAPANFLAANGLEYGEDESQTCGSATDACDLVVAARSYVLITGDYALDGIGSCTAANGRGCALMLVNVGDVSAEFTGILNNVFIVQGLYWNGGQNFLPTAVVAGLSHANYRMLNLANTRANPGANCSVPGGCITTDTRAVVTSGNQPLVAINTVGTR